MPIPRPAPAPPQVQPFPLPLPLYSITGTKTHQPIGRARAAQSLPSPGANWRTFLDDVNGISFRYPPDLKVAMPSVETAHIAGLVSVVQLWSGDMPRPALPVLTMHVLACDDRMAPCLDETQRRSCHSFEVFPLGNARAFQCVDFGSAACHWSAQVAHRGRQIRIQAPAAGHEVNGRAHDRSSCARAMTEIRTHSPIAGILAVLRIRPLDAEWHPEPTSLRCNCPTPALRLVHMFVCFDHWRKARRALHDSVFRRRAAGEPANDEERCRAQPT